jgi:hypothetical protein
LKRDDTSPPGRPIGLGDRERETKTRLTAPNLNLGRLISFEVRPRQQPVRLSEDYPSVNRLDDVSGLHTRQGERGAGYDGFHGKRTVIRRLPGVAQAGVGGPKRLLACVETERHDV